MRRWIAAGAALAALGLIANASAQEDYRRQVMSYLEHGLLPHAAAGYSTQRAIPDLVEPLLLDQPFLWEVQLNAGVNYRIYGACDIDCSDLDMEIYGADGRLADRDIALDDVPYVQITPQRSGRHYVRIWLYDCSAEPCYVAARVVSGGTPQPRVDEQPNRPVAEPT